jgi:PPM family protein phosphatase
VENFQPEQVAEHRFRHVITYVVGGNETGIHVEAHALDVRAGERLLLCSNGLTEMVTDDVIAAVLERELDPEAGAKELVALANEAGGRDNITVLIVRFDAVDPEPGSA